MKKFLLGIGLLLGLLGCTDVTVEPVLGDLVRLQGECRPGSMSQEIISGQREVSTWLEESPKIWILDFRLLLDPSWRKATYLLTYCEVEGTD